MGDGRVASMRRQEKVRQLIERRLSQLRLKQKAIAAFLEVSPSAITRKMKGENPFTDEEVRKLSDYLNMPDLFEYPTMMGDDTNPYERYDPGVRVFGNAVMHLAEKDKAEIYFVLALLLEGKLPRTTFGHMLRAIADLD